MDEIKLNKFERLSLVNQFLIMKGQGEEAINGNSYYSLEMINAAIEILSAGHEALYADVFNAISEPTSKEIGDEVYEILSLYFDALLSFEKLPKSEQTEELRSLIEFDGFDGNEEIEHYATLKVIVKDLNQFEGLFEDKKSLNSHMNRLSKYRNELAKSKEFTELYSLSAEGLYKIFK